MTVHATYALDQETADRIRALARAWGASPAEVIRRSVVAACDAAARKLSPTEVVVWYRNHKPVRTRAETRRRIRDLRDWRHGDNERRGPPRSRFDRS